MDFLINISIGILGILLCNIIAFRAFLKSKELATKVFWDAYYDTSKFIWLWSIMVLVVIAAIVAIDPETAGAIKTLTGWDFDETAASYFTLAIATWGLANAKKK